MIFQLYPTKDSMAISQFGSICMKLMEIGNGVMGNRYISWSIFSTKMLASPTFDNNLSMIHSFQRTFISRVITVHVMCNFI